MSNTKDFLNTDVKATYQFNGVSPLIGDVVISSYDKVVDSEGVDNVDNYNLLLCDGDVVDVTKHPELYNKTTTLPTIAAKDVRVPYKIIADNYNHVIGDIISSKNDKYKINGVDTFDMLECDGSVVDDNVYPNLSTVLPKSFSASSPLGDSYTSQLFPAICDSTGQIVYTMGADFYLKKSTDGGVTFNSLTGTLFASGMYQHHMTCSADGQIVYVGQEGGMRVSTDGGVTFTQKSQPPVDINSLSCSDDGSILFMGNFANDRAYISTNQATSFTQISGGTGGSQVCSDSTGDFFYANHYIGNYTNISKFQRSGTSSTLIASYNFGTSISAITRDMQDDSRLFVVTTDGTLHISDDFFITEDTYASSLGSLSNFASGNLYSTVSTTVTKFNENTNLPDYTPLDANFPKRIIADLTGGAY